MKQEIRKSIKILSFVMAILILILSMPVSAFAGAIGDTQEAADEIVNDLNENNMGQNDIFVIGEDENLREENIKHFKLSDGTTKAVVYSSAVHYKDSDGKWIDIDNALALNGNEYSANNKSEIKFANKSGSNGLVSIKDGEYKISFSPINTNKVTVEIENPQKTDSRKFEDVSKLNDLVSKAIYKNIYDGIDIEYILVGNNVKENIIVNEKKDSYTFSFEIELSKLKAKLINNEIILSDYGSGNTVYKIPCPYMLDASGEYSQSVEYSLTQNSKWKYTFTVTANAQWINSEERVFPVTVDPMVDFGGESINSYYLNNGVIKTNSTLLIGSGCEAYIELNSLPNIPANAHITSIILELNSRTSYGENYVGAYIGDATTPIDYNYIGLYEAKKFTWDIYKAYRTWKDNSYTTYKIRLEPINENSNSTTYYSTNSGDVSKHPNIVISYVDMTGLEDYYSYYKSSVGAAGVGYVNAFTGNLSFVHNLTTTVDEILPYSFNLTYNSNTRSWQFSTSETIVPQTINGIQHYKWIDSDGTAHWFSPILKRDSLGDYATYEYDDSGELVLVSLENITKYYDQDGLGLTLTVTGSNEYTVSDDKGNTKVFTNGFLSSIKDTYGNERTFSNIGGNLNSTSLKPNGNNAIRQIYTNDTGSIFYVFNEQNGESVELVYTGIALTSIKHTLNYNSSASYTVDFDYYNNGLLKSVTDNYSLVKTIYTYNNEKVVGINSYTLTVGNLTDENIGDSATITYNHMSTVYTPTIGGKSDLSSVYEFDYTGKVTTAYTYDVNGVVYGASNYAYNDQYKNGDLSPKVHNSLSSVLTSSLGAVNLLKNTDFEDGMNYWTTDNSGVSRSTPTLNTDNALNYGKSLWIRRTSAGTTKVEQSVYLTAGSYVFSASVLGKEISDDAVISLRLYNSNSSLIKSCQYERFNNNSEGAWEREILHFDISADGNYKVAIELTTSGTDTQNLYVDNVMLEKGNGAGYFSVYPNGDFESDIDTSKGLNASQSEQSYKSGDKSIKLTSDLSNEAYYKYTYTVFGGVAPEHLVISLWAKAENAVASTNVNNRALFGVRLVMSYNDITQTTEKFIPINAGNGNWQYISAKLGIDPLSDGPSGGSIKAIDVYLVYSYNAGNAYFDGVSISRGVKRTDYEYNNMGYVTKATDIDGKSTVYTYASNQTDLISVTDSKGNQSTATYDENRHIVTTGYESENMDAEASYERNDRGQILSTSVGVAASSKKFVTSCTYVEETASSYFGRVQTQTNENGETVTYYYTPKGLLEGVQNPDGNSVKYNYNAYGELASAELGMYDEDSGSFTANMDSPKEINYAYNANHMLERLTSESTAFEFAYDIYHRTQKIKAGNYTLANYEYYSNGSNLKKITYGNGAYFEYTYDILDRVVGICYNGVDKVKFIYSSNGNVSLVEDLQNGTSYHYYYSNEGVLLNEKAEKNGTTSYSRFYDYDDEGKLVEQWNYYSYGIDKTSYTRYFYNSDGAITRVEQNGNFESYSYDEFGRLVSISVNSNQSAANELEKVYTYIDTDTVATSRIQGEVISYGGNETDISYSYDLNGNISSIKNNEKIISYKYDESNQLIREDNEMLNKTYVYTYDSAGNITKRQTYAFTTSSTLTSLISEDVYSYEDNSWGDLLTSYNGVNFTYDQIGNPLTYYNGTSYTFTWQNGRELAALGSYGNLFEFKYNQDGVRIEKSVGDTTWKYVVNGTRIEKEYYYYNDNLSTETSYYYDANGYALSATVSFYESENVVKTYKYLFVTNLQGDVIAVTDENGVWLITYTYDAWGNFTAGYNYTSSELANKISYAFELPFRYRNYYYDYQTGLYYLNSRYYDSKLCRFINADGYVSTGQGLIATNMFAYCGNNPVNRIDSTGQFWFTSIVIVAVALVCATLLSSCQESEPEPYSKNANCYAYAMGLENDPRTGRPFEEKPQPGEFSGDRLSQFDLLPSEHADVVKEVFESKVSADASVLGLTFTEVDGPEHIAAEGNWLVALAYAPGYDYHWWKQNEDGTWSHKPGSYPIQQWDMSGNVIYDPRDCDRGIYTQFLGYYEVGYK